MSSGGGYRDIVAEVFAEGGIQLNGERPFDLTVHNDRFYQRFLRDGTLGLGESYMDGWWDCEQIDEMMSRLAGAKLAARFKRNPTFLLNKLKAHLTNQGSWAAARHGVRSHYDIGNDLYEAMLDERMVYTCAYWAHANDLAEAQQHKMELVCRKLGLQPGMRVLDIGCGFGSFAKYAAENYGAEVVGVTISKEQLAYAEKLCDGLPVEFRFQDYREITGSYERILSIGMFEHVGYKNHATYMKVVERCLTEDGLTLLHTIGRFDTKVRANDQFITRYIFPNTQVPSIAQIGAAIDGLLTVEDWENFGPDYERTLLAWHDNFVAAWPQLQDNYDERFYRMWRYYLLIFAGWFRARLLQLWQVVMSKDGVRGGYPWQQHRTRAEDLAEGGAR